MAFEVLAMMKMHLGMMQRGEITQQEYAHMNSILFYSYMLD